MVITNENTAISHQNGLSIIFLKNVYFSIYHLNKVSLFNIGFCRRYQETLKAKLFIFNIEINFNERQKNKVSGGGGVVTAPPPPPGKEFNFYLGVINKAAAKEITDSLGWQLCVALVDSQLPSGATATYKIRLLIFY